MLASNPTGDPDTDLTLNSIDNALRIELVVAADRYERVLIAVQARADVDCGPLAEAVAELRARVRVLDTNVAARTAAVMAARAAAAEQVPALAEEPEPVRAPPLRIPPALRRRRLRPVRSFFSGHG